jgi:hypothetical protein
MGGAKRILVFSDAGGTGRSYHASLDAKNQQRRCTSCWSRAGALTAPFRGLAAPTAPSGIGAGVPPGHHRLPRRAALHLDHRLAASMRLAR